MELEQVDTHRWRIPRQGTMRVDGLVFADERLMGGWDKPCVNEPTFALVWRGLPPSLHPLGQTSD